MRLILLCLVLMCPVRGIAQDVPVTHGDQGIAFIFITFSDIPTQRFTDLDATVASWMPRLDDLFREASYGQTRFQTGRAFGSYNLEIPASWGCLFGYWSFLAERAVQAEHGPDALTPYRHRYIVVPYGTPCNPMAEIGGSGPTHAWAHGLVEHEVGHMLGMAHTQRWVCSVSGCARVDYSGLCLMGMGSGQIVAPQKEQMGWFNGATAPTLQTVTTAAQYWLSAYEPHLPDTKALKIPTLTPDPNYGTPQNVYVESRHDGVLIHTSTDGYALSLATMSVDLDPITTAEDWRLDVGQTVTVSGVTLTLLSHDQSGALVDVQFPSTGPAPATHLRAL